MSVLLFSLPFFLSRMSATGVSTPATVSHLGQYPFLAEPWALVVSVPLFAALWTRVLALVQPLLDYVFSLGVIKSLDARLDALLAAFDKRFPAVAQFSFNQTFQDVRKTLQALLDALYAQLSKYQTQLSGYVDPLVKLTNDYYSAVIDTVLPYEQAIHKEFSSEYARAVGLLEETYTRIVKLATHASTLPAHVSQVYVDESSNTKTTTEAVTKTTQKLSQEAYSTIKPALNRIVGAAEPVEEKTKDTLAEAAAAVEKISDAAIEELRASGVEVR